LNLESLSTRKHWAGDEIKIKVWRENKFLDLKYQLPKVEYTTEVVPDYVFNKEPEYLLLGGLLFQPLTGPYLQSWGATDWQRRAPFRLTYLAKKKSHPGHAERRCPFANPSRPLQPRLPGRALLDRR
jgi:hypothetical protein